MAEKRGRPARRKPPVATSLAERVLDLMYEFYALGKGREAKPLLLWLVELAWEAEQKEPPDYEAVKVLRARYASHGEDT
jgi:hypothetical protein